MENYAVQSRSQFLVESIQKIFPWGGAGLAICRQLAEHHCGNVSLQSEEGNGTLALISLPIIDAGRDS